MKVLVLTGQPITAQQLRDALGDVDPTDAEVKVVAPALAEGPLQFLFSDADDAIARAEKVWAQSVEQLRDDDVSASGDTGESDPLTAIQDGLQTFTADRIVIFARADDQRFREDVAAGEARERFGIPVERVELPA